MATKSSTIEIPLSASECFALVQSLGTEMGYASDEAKQNEYIRWNVKAKLLLLEVSLKPTGEKTTSLTVIATDKLALVDGAGALQGLVDNFLRKVKEKAGLPITTADEMPKRSGCLTAFLILAMIGNAILALFQWFSIQNLYVNDKPLAFLGGAFNAVALVFAIAIWKWKRWGAYGYVGTMVASLLLSLTVGQTLLALQSLVPIALLIGLLQPVWKYFYKQQPLSPAERIVILFLAFVILAVIGVFPYALIYILRSVSLPIFIALYLVIFMMVCGTTFLITRYVSASPLVWFIPFTAWLIAEVVFMVLLRFSGDVVSVMLRQLKYLFESGFGIVGDFALPTSASFITWTTGGLIGGLGGWLASKLVRRR